MGITRETQSVLGATVVCDDALDRVLTKGLVPLPRTESLPFGFAGGLCDVDTGLCRFGARGYDAETGGWTAPDPSLVSGGENLYESAYGDPVNWVDLSGTTPNPAMWSATRGGWLEALGFGAFASGLKNRADGIAMIGRATIGAGVADLAVGVVKIAGSGPRGWWN